MFPTKIVTVLITVAVVKHQCYHHHKSHHRHSRVADILQPNNNFFTQITQSAQTVVNGIFDSLKLSQQFSKESKIKSLTKMHNDLNNISAKNFEAYDVLKNVIVEVDNKPINQIRMNDYIIKILNGIEFDVYNKTEKEHLEYIRNNSTNGTFTPEFANYKEWKQFVGGFVGKLKRLTVDDLFAKKQNVQAESELEQSGRRNLEIWEPPPPEEMGLFNNETRRIYGGKRTSILQFPFIVSIHILEEFTCAGSILTSDLIITAASCLQIHHNNRFFRENPKTTYVRVGSDWTSRRGESIPVLEIYFYPQYDPKTLNHNVAIVRLKRRLHLHGRGKLKIKRILLDHGDGNLAANTHEITILGWGARKEAQIVDPFVKLTYSVLSIYHINECRDIYSKAFVTINHFCAGFMSKGGGACNRDVGGPGIVNNLLVGIVSFGAPVCGAPDAPTVFTRIGHYIDWIENVMAMQPVVYGVATTSSPNDKFLIYFNTRPPITFPTIYPVDRLFTHRPLAKTIDLRSHDTNGEPDETVILSQIINMANSNDIMVHDVINHDLYKDFQDIIKTNDENVTSNQTMMKETKFVTSDVTIPPTSEHAKPSFVLRSKPPLFSRPPDEYGQYDVYGANNYEYGTRKN